VLVLRCMCFAQLRADLSSVATATFRAASSQASAFRGPWCLTCGGHFFAGTLPHFAAAQLRHQATWAEYLANWADVLGPARRRLAVHLERKTPWDS
jgi:hypothetical protein